MGRRFSLAVMFVVISALPVWAQTVRKVCASGTSGTGDDTYTLTQLQTAINDAVGGDSILLQRGNIFVGTFTLPIHTGTADVTIRTGVESNCAVTSTSVFPAANLRMTTAAAASGNLAKIQSNTNNIAGIRTANPVGGTAAKDWKLQWLEFIPSTYAGGCLLQLGSDDDTVQTINAEIPEDFTVDQNYFRGDSVYGQFRGVCLHANDVTLTNNTIKDIKSQQEGQGVWVNSTIGPLVIENNYIEGSAENVLFGGGSGCCRPVVTIASATSATAMVLSARTDLHVGQGLTVANALGEEEYAEVVTCGTSTPGQLCSSNTITITPALGGGTPSVGADVDWGTVPGALTFRKNHIYKPTTWRDPILGTPQSVTTATIAGGSLVAGTYYYRVEARIGTAGGQTARSTASVEVSRLLSATGSVKISWAAVTNATSYRVYGRSSGGQNMYWTVTAPVVEYTDTGSAGTTGNIATTSGSLWYVKNIFELKNISGALIEGNVFENIWDANQDGYAIVFTPANTGNGNDSTTFRDVIFRNNIVRHAGGCIQIMARGGTTGRMIGLTVNNNLCYDISNAWGPSAGLRTVLITTTVSADSDHAGNEHGPLNTVFDHNTFDHVTGNAMLWFDLFKDSAYRSAENFTWSNNIGSKLSYGVYGYNCTQGNDCWTDHTKGTRIWQNSVVTDATCANYPGGCTETLAPTRATMQTQYENYAAEDFRLKSTSTYHNAASDGTDIGANVSAIQAFTNVALSGDDTGGTPVLPPTIETPSLPNGTVGSSYAATLTGTCPSTPCTWSSTGTLPSGTSLTSTSSTSATITGPAQAAGTFVFSIIITDSSGTRSDTQDYSVTMTEVIIQPVDPDDPDPTRPVPLRPDRFNLDERVIFGRATDPRADGEPTRNGDLKANTGCSSMVLEVLETTSPIDYWRPVAFRPRLTATTIVTAGAVTYTASELIGGLILRDPNGAGRSDVTPTAALIVAAIPCPAVGDVFDVDIRNTADAAETITVTAGAGVTLSGTMTIAQNNTRRFKAVVTNVGTPAVTIYSIGSVVH